MNPSAAGLAKWFFFFCFLIIVISFRDRISSTVSPAARASRFSHVIVKRCFYRYRHILYTGHVANSKSARSLIYRKRHRVPEKRNGRSRDNNSRENHCGHRANPFFRTHSTIFGYFLFFPVRRQSHGSRNLLVTFSCRVRVSPVTIRVRRDGLRGVVEYTLIVLKSTLRARTRPFFLVNCFLYILKTRI